MKPIQHACILNLLEITEKAKLKSYSASLPTSTWIMNQMFYCFLFIFCKLPEKPSSKTELHFLTQQSKFFRLMQSCNQKENSHSESNNQNLLASVLQKQSILDLPMNGLAVQKGDVALLLGGWTAAAPGTRVSAQAFHFWGVNYTARKEEIIWNIPCKTL